MEGIALNQKLRLYNDCEPTNGEGRLSVANEPNEGILRLWPEPKPLRVVEQINEALAKSTPKKKSGVYYKSQITAI